MVQIRSWARLISQEVMGTLIDSSWMSAYNGDGWAGIGPYANQGAQAGKTQQRPAVEAFLGMDGVLRGLGQLLGSWDSDCRSRHLQNDHVGVHRP